MATLHTVNKSPFERNSLDTCLSLCNNSGSILLIEDAVVGALRNTSVSERLVKAIESGVKIFALGEDLKARGLPEDRVIEKITLVDYTGFVKLATENDRVQSWL
ncbi:MAG: sulfurtransferase complex subunit TusB [Proteobacteria bacterium]|nr:sulfurtransferase complex subunit TusB [Pseudomonadota bacterium]